MPNSMHVYFYGGKCERSPDFASPTDTVPMIEKNIDQLKALVNNPNFESMALTAVIKNGTTINVHEISSMKNLEDEKHTVHVNNVDWRHTLPESADTTFGAIADAIAMFDADDADNPYAHHVDIGTSPIGKLVVVGATVESTEDDEDLEDD